MSSLIIRDSYEGGYDHGSLLRAEIREGFGKHQIVMLDYPVPDSDFVNLAPEMTPLAFRWGYDPAGLRTFYGYVNHHEVIDSQNYGSVLRVFCIGTSQPLNDPTPRAWRNVTASYVARLVAEKHGLRALVHKSKVILPYATSGQDSDMGLLNRLADSSGYRFWVDGATLHFVDPQVLLSTPDRSVAATYTFDKQASDTLYKVHNIQGSMAPVSTAAAVQKIFGLDSTGLLIRSNSTQMLHERGLAVPTNTEVYRGSVNSLEQAQQINEAAAVSGGWANLQVTTRGDGRARVGGLVNLEGSKLRQALTGTWVASDITHILDITQMSRAWVYNTEIELIRNQSDHASFSTEHSVKDALSEVPAVLRNGKWESSNMESVYV